MGNDLLIKINADAANAQKAFDDIRSKTEDLEGALASAAKISALAFAALTAEIYFAEKAFNEARESSVQLSNALQNQGIYTDELKSKYEGYADAVQAATGIDNDAVIKAQALAQTYLGQTEITQELTNAIADLGAQMGGDLNGAAEKIARTIGTGTNAFARQGLKINESATEAERYGKVLEFVQFKAGGLAAEFNKADGYTKALATSFGNLQEALGQRFSPIIERARLIAIGFFDLFTNNPLLADLAAAAIIAGTAVTGLVAATAAGIPIFLAFNALVAALEISAGALVVTIGSVVLIVAAVVAGITLLALNWDKVMAGLVAAARGAVVFLTETFTGLGNVLRGIFEWDEEKLKKGLGQIGDSFKKTKDEVVDTYQQVTIAQREEGEKQNADKKRLADEEAAKKVQHQQNLVAIDKAGLDLIRLQNQNASAEMIALKSKEIETLKALDSDKSATEIALLQQRLATIRALEDEQRQSDLEKQAEFRQIQAEAKQELDDQGIEINNQLRADELAAIQAHAQSSIDIDKQTQTQILEKKIAARNQELADTKKYGEAYAKIHKAISSDEVQGTKDAANELVALQQSKNATLKGIGKAAAITQIGISTAEAAMRVFDGFATIPIIGPALGIAGAAATVAFGAEKISDVVSAQDGGLIEGGIPGKDSVPALLEPGELVVPRRNFADVVKSQGTSEVGNQEMLGILNQINEKFSNPQTTIINGDVSSDDSFIDAMVRKISDAVEFRNQKIYGVV